jgi:hypothetical protein
MKDDTDRSSQFNFQDVYAQEKAEISKRREKHFDAQQSNDDGANDGFVGLALSGGGIRSATFCLGFLQELHRLKILRIFDYLSTVSGGGYLGGWWSAWLSREEVLVRAKEESPIFIAKDIKNVASLVTKLRDSSDEVSRELKKQMRANPAGRETLKLIEMSEEGKPPAPKLVDGLVAELNLFLSKPPRTGAPILNWPEPTSTKPVRRLFTGETTSNDQQQLASEKDLWTNRIHLEHTYPYELRNIFPPGEQIEPKRNFERKSGAASDGSLCAWEDPIHHLRLFANYLTPRKGLLSADTWRAVSVIMRNLLLTWLILLPILTALMLLGQAYFLFLSPEAFVHAVPISIYWALPPIGTLLGFNVAMAIAWLLCNRDSTSSIDLIAQVVCFFALGTLLVSAIWVIPHKDQPWQAIQSHRSTLMVLGALALIIILIMWHWRINRQDLSGKNRETILRWKREVRRGRFSRAQARLLVLTCIVAAVLLVSWLSCEIFSGAGNIFSFGGENYSLAWLSVIPALLSAVGGSIFTAMRTAPSAGVDKPTSHKPSAISRFILAVTPGLVVLVLAVLAAWFAHWLLYASVRMALDSAGRDNLNLLLRAAGFLIITIFLALAIYELKDVKWSGMLKPSFRSLTFIALLIVNASWLWQALFVSVIGHQQRWLLSAILASSVLVIIRRTTPSGKWKWRLLYRHLALVGIHLRETRKANPRIARPLLIFLAPTVGVVIFAALTLIGKVIGEAIFSYTNKVQEGKVLGALVLALASLAGGTILYRLLTVRQTKVRHRQVFESRLFSNKTFSKRPEWLWTLASLCLICPLILLSLAYELNQRAVHLSWLNKPILFPAALAILLAGLIALRSLVLQRPESATPLVSWAGRPLDWILGKIPKVNGRKVQAFRLLAFLALSAMLLGDIVARNEFADASVGVMGEALIRAEWLFLGVALLVNLPIFGVAVFKLPGQQALTFKPTSWVYRKPTLWALAFICMSVALFTGYLLTNWLEQLSRIHLEAGLTPLLLPVAVGCLLMIVFEMIWGKRENRRSLWLIGIAYLGIAAIFFMGLVASEPGLLQTMGPVPTPSKPAPLDSIRIILGLFAAVSVWVVSLGWMVDPNSVSMHQFYRGRLVRAYLGASNIRRRSHGKKEITDTVAGDDLPLNSLTNCEKGGPYHLINTTLNLVAGRDLATAQRSASSFILSQKYCGSGRTNYRPTDEYMQGLLSLGTAIAASGAAVSPNMGSKKQTAALAMLMTLLNVRLGYWAPTPNQHGWNSSQPRLWPFYLIREFLSQTNDLSSYCYLTDGGHFDNTGLYPLIERGCRFIVLLDCGADPQPSCFQDLGEVIRRCRIDFGTEIKLDLKSLIAAPGENMDQCFVNGQIQFSREHLSMLRNNHNDADEADDDSGTGIIMYFKPSVITEVTADVRQYSLENSFFPQQTTANQWFDEAQFESYRRLGMICASKAFDNDVGAEISKASRLTTNALEALFMGLVNKFPSQN